MTPWLNFTHFDVPTHTQKSFEDYIIHGYPPGSFIYAVLRNDFVMAASKADHVNAECLQDIARWLINVPPLACWRTKENIDNWIADKDGVRTSYVEPIEKRRMWEALSETEK